MYLKVAFLSKKYISFIFISPLVCVCYFGHSILRYFCTYLCPCCVCVLLLGRCVMLYQQLEYCGECWMFCDGVAALNDYGNYEYE